MSRSRKKKEAAAAAPALAYFPYFVILQKLRRARARVSCLWESRVIKLRRRKRSESYLQ
jgi:hypothetical protein